MVLDNSPQFKKAELIIAGLILLIIFCFDVFNSSVNKIDYLPGLFLRYIFFFGIFWILNNIILPQLLHRKQDWLNSFLTAVVFLSTAAVIEITGMLLPQHQVQPETDSLFLGSFQLAWWVFLTYITYFFIKSGLIYYLNYSKSEKRYRLLAKDALILAAIWLIGLLLLSAGRAEEELLWGWSMSVPFAVLLYSWSFFYVAPKVLPKRKSFLRYVASLLLALIVSFLPYTFVAFLLSGNAEAALSFAGGNLFIQLFITVPLSWFMVKRHIRGNEELYQLQKELNQSNASLDLLRSQINPHFLFNAFNTIYGLAIQEKAERTTEGIEKLSDMMRFMLQENMKETISLGKEVEYMENYISIQKLRTDPNPNIKLEVDIQKPVAPAIIAPMLLIPFVENAFKHGISFREPSVIRIVLKQDADNLYFDVYNSRHTKQEHDPEKNSNGIGLNNVKQRLELLYAGKHELTVRETPASFFVHLTLQLQ